MPGGVAFAFILEYKTSVEFNLDFIGYHIFSNLGTCYGCPTDLNRLDLDAVYWPWCLIIFSDGDLSSHPARWRMHNYENVENTNPLSVTRIAEISYILSILTFTTHFCHYEIPRETQPGECLFLTSANFSILKSVVNKWVGKTILRSLATHSGSKATTISSARFSSIPKLYPR